MQRLEREHRCKMLLARWKEIGDEINKVTTKKSRLVTLRNEQESIMKAVKVEREHLRQLKDKRRDWMQQMLNNHTTRSHRQKQT